MTRHLVCMAVCWASIGGVYAQTPVNWSGFYVSAGVGWTEADARTATVVAPGGIYFITTDLAQIADAGAGKLSHGGLSGGIATGYGKQFGRVLAGIEASANTLSFDESRSATQIFQTITTAQFTLTQSVEADWMATLRGRLGWTQDNWLAYVTGGAAITRATLRTIYSDNFVAGGVTGTSGGSSTTKSKVGWTAGLGGEYALTRQWALRADYQYAHLGSVTTSTSVFHPGNNQTSVLNSSADLRAHTVLIGVSRRFH